MSPRSVGLLGFVALLVLSACAGLRSTECELRGGVSYRQVPRWQTCTRFADFEICDAPTSAYYPFLACSR